MKNTLITLALVVASTTAFAQSAKTTSTASQGSLTAELVKNVEIAPTLGITSFGLSVKGEDFEQSQGVAVGVLAQSKIVDNIRAQAGVMYMDAGGEKGNIELNYTYIGLPLSGLYYVPQAPTGMFLKAGVLPVYMIDAELERGSTTRSIGTQVNRWDVIPSLGVGYEVRNLGFSAMMLELNYNYGLMDAQRGEAEAYNRGLMLTGTIAL